MAVLQNENLVAVIYRAEAMCNEHRSPSLVSQNLVDILEKGSLSIGV